MKILIATDVVLIRNNGHYYLSSAFGSILKRYYENFEKVILLSRIQDDIPPSKYFCVDDYIEEAIPDTLKNALLKKDKKTVKEAILKCDLVVGRCPSMIAYNALSLARKMGKPTFAEVVADPWDAYWNHSLKGKILAPYMYFAARKNIKKANYALYVTNEFLQKRYPCKNKTIGISDVKIESVEDDVLEKRISKIENMNIGELSIVTTAAVNVRYKGQQYAIKAIPKLNRLGIKIKYIMVGGGDQTYLQNLAKKLKITDQVEFTGFLSANEIFEIIDYADIYIQPSLQEGLPRAVVEAMSRACPCLGAKTGGIPELIHQNCVTKRKSPKSIAKTILNIRSKEMMKKLAVDNFNSSKLFLNSSLAKKRDEFYAIIKREFKEQLN